jgi:hypothetical protein
MSTHTRIGKLLALALGLGLLTGAATVDAKKPPAKPPAVAAEPAKLETPLSIPPRGLDMGLTEKGVAKVYDDQIDKDFLPKWEEAQPGVQQKMLEGEIQQKKEEFRQSRVEFGNLPTNLDGTAFTGEFTYNNGETMYSIARKGYKRNLFFIKGKLWKIIDVYPLGKGLRFGEDLKSAIEKIEKLLGVPGRMLAPKPEEGRNRSELDWQDSRIHLRAAAWSEKEFALIYEDRDTLGRLSSLRTAKVSNEKQLDPETKANLR